MKFLFLILVLLQSSLSFAMTAQDRAEIKYWKSEYKKNKKDTVALYNLATAYFYARQYKQAAKYYAWVSKRKSKLTYLAYYYLAVSLIEIERYEKSYRIFMALDKKRIPSDLRKRVREYIALFQGGEGEDQPSEKKEKGFDFLSRFSATMEASYGQNSNPAYSTSDDETSSPVTIANLYFGVKAIDQPKYTLEPYISHYQEKYSDLSSSDTTTQDIGLSYFQFLKQGYLQVNPYLSSDSDEDSDTFVRTGGSVTYGHKNEDIFTLTYYDTSSDDEDLTYYTGSTIEASYTNMFSERKDEFRYTTLKVFKNDLNDVDDYYNSNRGVDIATGVTRYFEKSNITGSLKFTYKEYVEDETLGMARYDKTWNISVRYSYPITKYFSAIASGSYIKNGSNWEDIDDYDPTYEVQSYSIGLTGAL